MGRFGLCTVRAHCALNVTKNRTQQQCYITTTMLYYMNMDELNHTCNSCANRHPKLISGRGLSFWLWVSQSQAIVAQTLLG